MHEPYKIGCSWSGGKDSCYALMLAKDLGYEPTVLLNVMNEEGKISRSHGIPLNILKAQAAVAGLPIELLSSSWQDYEKKFTGSLMKVKEEFGISHMVFGDIDLDAHREWEEKVCNNSALEAILPLWKKDRSELINSMIHAGIKTMIVSCNTHLGEKFLGKILTHETVAELEQAGVDVCGENGEFHTLVLDSPLFSRSVNVDIIATMQHQDYWFCELLLKEN